MEEWRGKGGGKGRRWRSGEVREEGRGGDGGVER